MPAAFEAQPARARGAMLRPAARPAGTRVGALAHLKQGHNETARAAARPFHNLKGSPLGPGARPDFLLGRSSLGRHRARLGLGLPQGVKAHPGHKVAQALLALPLLLEERKDGLQERLDVLRRSKGSRSVVCVGGGGGLGCC